MSLADKIRKILFAGALGLSLSLVSCGYSENKALKERVKNYGYHTGQRGRTLKDMKVFRGDLFSAPFGEERIVFYRVEPYKNDAGIMVRNDGGVLVFSGPPNYDFLDQRGILSWDNIKDVRIEKENCVALIVETTSVNGVAEHELRKYKVVYPVETNIRGQSGLRYSMVEELTK